MAVSLLRIGFGVYTKKMHRRRGAERWSSVIRNKEETLYAILDHKAGRAMQSMES